MSQDELARRLGYHSRSSVNKIESGKTNISLTKILDLAHALETTPAELLSEHSVLGSTPAEENTVLVMNRGGKTISYRLPEKQMKQVENILRTLYEEFMEDSEC